MDIHIDIEICRLTLDISSVQLLGLVTKSLNRFLGYESVVSDFYLELSVGNLYK